MSHQTLTAHGTIERRDGRANVTITTSARDAIVRHAREARHVESGGGLYQAKDIEHGPVTIRRANGPTRDTRQRMRSLELDRVEMDTPGLVGCWHSHPFGSPTLSTTDITTFATMRARARRPQRAFVAIITAPHDTDRSCKWDAPQLAAWVFGAGYYQPATLEIVPDRATAQRSAPATRSTSTFNPHGNHGATDHFRELAMRRAIARGEIR